MTPKILQAAQTITDWTREYKSPLLVFVLIFSAMALDQAYLENNIAPYFKGVKQLKANNTDAAISLLSKALQKDPEHTRARVQLGLAYRQKNWPEEAIRELELASKNAEEMLYSTHHHLGLIYLARSEHRKALGHLSTALKYNNTNAETHYHAGMAAEGLGLRKDARKHYETSLVIAPEYAPSQERLSALRK